METLISNFSDRKSDSYEELFSLIKNVPKEILPEISNYVNYLLYKYSKKISENQEDIKKIYDSKNKIEKFCAKELSDELAADNYMIGKPFPNVDFNLEQAIAEDENDESAPEAWVEKMFPELYV